MPRKRELVRLSKKAKCPHCRRVVHVDVDVAAAIVDAQRLMDELRKDPASFTGTRRLQAKLREAERLTRIRVHARAR